MQIERIDEGKRILEILNNTPELDFYYNNFGGEVHGLYRVETDLQEVFIPYRCQKMTCELGAWLIRLDNDSFNALIKRIFADMSVVRVTCQYICLDKSDKLSFDVHYKLILPADEEAIDKDGSAKSRHTLRRKRKLLSERIGELRVVDSKIEDCIYDDALNDFFSWKMRTHNRDYHMSGQEYVNSRAVTNIYELFAGDKRCAVVLTNEAYSICMFINISYDSEMAEYSPGVLLYDEMIKSLIKKKKKILYLGGGERFQYKLRHGAIVDDAYSGVVYRNRLCKIGWQALKRVKEAI